MEQTLFFFLFKELTFTVTLTLKVVFKSFLSLFWFKKMHHYTKFGCKWYCHTEDFIQTKTRQMNKLIIDSFKIHKYPLPPPLKQNKQKNQNWGEGNINTLQEDTNITSVSLEKKEALFLFLCHPSLLAQ